MQYLFALSVYEVEPKSILFETNSNTTITHYCPIELNLNQIDDFVVGSPVYITGKVYKFSKDYNTFVAATEFDAIDCITSVKTNGAWYEFIGICVEIDVQHNCIKFASAGDYVVLVSDSSCYEIGNELFVDTEDNVLKVLSGATALTSKIRRTIVGIVTAKLSKNVLAVFKA